VCEREREEEEEEEEGESIDDQESRSVSDLVQQHVEFWTMRLQGKPIWTVQLAGHTPVVMIPYLFHLEE
jgi:hypothetical protein